MEQGILDDMEPPELAHAHGNALHQDALRGGTGLVLGFQIGRQGFKVMLLVGIEPFAGPDAMLERCAIPLPCLQGWWARFCLPWYASRSIGFGKQTTSMTQ